MRCTWRRVRIVAAAGVAASIRGCPLVWGGERLHVTAYVTPGITKLPHESSPVLSFGDSWRGPHEAPRGLHYCPDFVTEEEEAEVVSSLDSDGSAWARYIRRAQQFYGLVYYQTSHKVPALQPTGQSAEGDQYGRSLSELPEWLVPRVTSTGAFSSTAEVNQVQGNEYLEDSGIGLHVEDPAAGDSFATLSLLAPVEFTLMRACDGKPLNKHVRDQHDFIKVLLEPRSLLVLQGESRYEFAHAIRQSKLVHLRNGSILRRTENYRRVSLTFRSILKEQRRAVRSDLPEGYDVYAVQHPVAAASASV